MVVEFATAILEIFVRFFEVISALLIAFGGLRAVIKIVLLEVFKKPENYTNIRKEFTDKILFGLEILIIADILETLRKPYLDELVLVGAIVIIRTVLGYFLSKEAEETVV
jgi:uncharacterized membrane protein